ncbi:MAG TPA: FHA domain-containing protein [Anaerolineae bacterium]|nr:FHA domain-containing protein [Anaerolineae bacterium]
MIKCPFCSSVYPENTLFCEECGSYLAPSSGQATDPLDNAEGDEEATDQSAGAFTSLVLSIEDGGRIELPLTKEVVIGRLDASHAVFPDVDLTNEQGAEKGVSRRHARISRRDDQVFLEDLNSLNGTFLNAQRLVPELPYPLKGGDQVQLGKLILTINLK